jgi:hypothetical protein
MDFLFIQNLKIQAKFSISFQVKLFICNFAVIKKRNKKNEHIKRFI